MRDLAHAGITVEPHGADFEGGDVLVLPGRCAFLGYGFRSSRNAALVIERFLGLPVIPLELVDPALYHLDTALTVFADGTALACDEAFAPAARRGLREVCSVIQVSRDAAIRFAINLVELGDAVVTGTDSAEVSAILESLGKRIVYTPLDEFHRAGGSAACLLAPVLDHATDATAETTAMRSTAA
jgi:N-dimethylarginine dimethylaminohydrolase